MKRKVLLSIPCWGEKYHAKWTQYSLPSLLADGNIPALIRAGYEVCVCIYTREDHYESLKQAVEALHLPKELALSYRILEEFVDDISSKNNIHLFSVAHQHTLEEGTAQEAIVFLLCCDALLNDTALSFAVNKAEQGYKAVLNSAVRVNFEDCRSILDQQKTHANALALPARSLVDLIVKHIHDDEKKLARPTLYGPLGWPGICSWFKPTQGYIKHSYYFNPTLIVPDKTLSLNGATFDSSEMMNDFIDHWDKVYIVTQSDELTILDLADKGVNHLPITTRRLSALDVALEKQLWQLPAWQERVFCHKVVFLAEQDESVQALIHESELFLEQVASWNKLLSSKDVSIEDERLTIINQKYANVYGFEHEAIEQALEVLFEPYKNSVVLLYGMGELCEFIVKQFRINVKEILLSDSAITDAKRSRFSHRAINICQGNTNFDVAIPMTIQFHQEIAERIKELAGHDVKIKTIDWFALLSARQTAKNT